MFSLTFILRNIFIVLQIHYSNKIFTISDITFAMSEENKQFSCVLCGAKLVSKELLQEHFR